MKIQIKKQISVLSSIALMGMLFFISGCSHDTEVVKSDAEVENDTGQVEFVDNLPKPISDYSREEVLKEVLPVLKKFIDSQFSYAMGKDKEPQWNNYLWKADMKLKQMVDDVVARDKYRGSSILEYSGSLSVDKHTNISLSGDVWCLDYMYNKIYMKKGRDISAPLFDMDWVYSFSVKKDDNNQWKIVSWKDNEGITENSIWYRGDLKVLKQINQISTRSLSSYDRDAAVRYAKKYWNNPNTNKWCDYSNYGGDCTNFVSQCLIAGGWKQKKGSSYCSNSVWFHKGAGHMWNNTTPKNYSCSWTLANKFFEYMEQVPSVSKSWLGNVSIAARLGDVVSKKAGSRATHTMIVSYIGDYEIYVAFRNGVGSQYKPRKYYPLSLFNQKHLYYWSIDGRNGLLA